MFLVGLTYSEKFFMIKITQSSDLRNNFRDALAHVKETRVLRIVAECGIPISVIVDIGAYEDYISIRNPRFIASVKKSRREKKVAIFCRPPVCVVRLSSV